MTVDFRSDELREKSLARVDVLQRSWTKKVIEKSPSSSTVPATDQAIAAIPSKRVWNNSVVSEIMILFQRNMKDVMRDKATFGATIGQSIINVLLLGYI